MNTVTEFLIKESTTRHTASSSFQADLDYSHKQSQRAFWAEAYKRYFDDSSLTTDLVVPVENRPDNGIDKIIHFSNGRSASVDEKCHRANGFIDNMIFLEMNHINSDGSYRSKGWITDKGKQCDYLAYAKEDTEQVFIFPFKEMQRAFDLHGADWQIRYNVTSTPNGTYSSECVLVPADVISDAIQQNFVVSIPHKFWI